MSEMLIIGHRGAKGHLAENTLESFRKALDLGADAIEFDVHLSAEGEVIVIHDETVNRTTDGTGRVADLSLSQLKKLKIDGRYSIPTLSEVIDAMPKNTLLNVEIKVKIAAKPAMHLIEKFVAGGRDYRDFLVSSFDWVALKEIREANPQIPLGVLTDTDLELAIAFSKSIKAETIHPQFHLLTQENTRQMQEQAFGVYPWTINEFEDLARIKSFKPNGIITDFPDRL